MLASRRKNSVLESISNERVIKVEEKEMQEEIMKDFTLLNLKDMG